MIELKRISDEKIMNIGLTTSYNSGLFWGTVGQKVAQAQLEADQKVIDELKDWYDKLLEDYKRLKTEGAIVQEIFEGAERLCPHIKNFAKWQALKQKYGVTNG